MFQFNIKIYKILGNTKKIKRTQWERIQEKFVWKQTKPNAEEEEEKNE